MIARVRRGLLGRDLGHRVGHREDDRVVAHARERLGGITRGAGEADEDVGAVEHVGGRRRCAARGFVSLGEPALDRRHRAVRCRRAVCSAPWESQPTMLRTPACEQDLARPRRRRRRAPTISDLEVLEPLADDLERVEQRRQHDDRGAVLVVVEDGDVELGLAAGPRSRSSAAREMSSRLMPPKPGAIALTVATISSGSLVSRQIGNASTPANSLNSIALPSITGIAASGPMSPRPSTAVPSVTTATVLRLIVYWKALSRSSWIAMQTRATPGRVGHREVVAGLQRVLVALLDLAAEVHAERAVGDVDDRRRRRRASTAATICAPCSSPAVSTVMSRRVCPPVERDEVDGADRAAGVADRAGDLAEHSGAVVDLDADGQGVLRGRGSSHGRGMLGELGFAPE